jgi:hypothetical protein
MPSFDGLSFRRTRLPLQKLAHEIDVARLRYSREPPRVLREPNVLVDQVAICELHSTADLLLSPSVETVLRAGSQPKGRDKLLRFPVQELLGGRVIRVMNDATVKV